MSHPDRPAYEIAQPKLAIGTKVARDLVMGAGTMDGSYYRRRILRDKLRNTRRIIKGLKRQGYMTGWSGGKMPEYNKDQIRLMMRVIDTAYEVEISGSVAKSAHIDYSSIHQSYISEGQSHSGASIQCTLLFRAVIITNGKEQHVCVNIPDPMFSEIKLAAAVIPQ